MDGIDARRGICALPTASMDCRMKRGQKVKAPGWVPGAALRGLAVGGVSPPGMLSVFVLILLVSDLVVQYFMKKDQIIFWTPLSRCALLKRVFKTEIKEYAPIACALSNAHR